MTGRGRGVAVHGLLLLFLSVTAADDAEVLLAFKNSDPTNARLLANWRPRTNPCGSNLECHGGRYSSQDCAGGWTGVKACKGGRVVVLRLSRTNVAGDVGMLGRLTALTSLELASSGVTGDVDGLGRLTALTFMDLHSTQVAGNIDRLGGMTALTYMGLSGTKVGGDVGGLAGMTALTYLHLAGAPVGGDIGRLAGLTQLEDLHLDGCPNVYGDATALAVAAGPHEQFYHDSCSPRADCDTDWEQCGHECGCGSPAGGANAIGRSDAACCSCELVDHGSCPSPVAGSGPCTCDGGWTGERCESGAAGLPGAGLATPARQSTSISTCGDGVHVIVECTLEGLGRLTGASCPAADAGAPAPSSCPIECATAFTAWWDACHTMPRVISLELRPALGRFNILCDAEIADCRKENPSPSGKGSGH